MAAAARLVPDLGDPGDPGPLAAVMPSWFFGVLSQEQISLLEVRPGQSDSAAPFDPSVERVGPGLVAEDLLVAAQRGPVERLAFPIPAEPAELQRQSPRSVPLSAATFTASAVMLERWDIETAAGLAFHVSGRASDNLQLAGLTAGMARRTFMRAFSTEAGMPFGRWRQQARLFAALEMLAERKSVTETAMAVGYDSVSAFIQMFRTSLGATPQAYLRSNREQRSTVPE